MFLIVIQFFYNLPYEHEQFIHIACYPIVNNKRQHNYCRIYKSRAE